MDQFFSTFFLYSFLGFLIEVAYTRLCHHPKQDRKCLLFLPLCPVYGLGALAVLSLPALLLRRPLLVFLAGALVATLVEYVVAVLHSHHALAGRARRRRCHYLQHVQAAG